MKQQHIHFIGICGVAMSALALAFKREGWHVTGSDVGFYPPVSTHLKDAGVKFYAGWHPDKMVANGVPDLVVVGNVASSTNPEWLYVQEHKLNYKSYPEVIAEHFIKPHSIVCAGTYGKSTSTSILTWILKEAGYDPSYMFGGIMCEVTPPYPPLKMGGSVVPPHFKEGAYGGGQSNLPSAALSNSAWSIMEGDEYKASRWDKGPKFAYYSPTHLLLTSVVWDHADVYQTEADYIAAFQKLVDLVPTDGLQVISEKALSVILSPEPKRRSGTKNPPPYVSLKPRDPSVGSLPQDGNFVVTYGRDPSNDYVYTNIVQSTNGTTFDIIHGDKKYPVTTTCLGEYMADNMTGCFALCHQIGIAPEKIIASIKTFAGMKRRLEKRYENGVTIFDDIAHSPSKARAILETLREVYVRPLPTLPLKGEENADSPPFKGEIQRGSHRPKIIGIFEPNTGNRRAEAATWYDNAFSAADEIIIPRLTKLKQTQLTTSLGKGIATPRPSRRAGLAMTSEIMEGDELAKIIGRTHANTSYIDDDEQLLNYVKEKIQPGDVVVFMGSHGFRGMIERLVASLRAK